LRVTLINLFRTPITIQYPEVDIRQKDLKAFGYKGPLGPLPDRSVGFCASTQRSALLAIFA